jgi:hypothetical protein
VQDVHKIFSMFQSVIEIMVYNCMKQNDNIYLEFALVTFHKGISYNVAAAEMTFCLGPDIFRIRGVMVSVAVTILCLNVLTVFTHLMAS